MSALPVFRRKTNNGFTFAFRVAKNNDTSSNASGVVWIGWDNSEYRHMQPILNQSTGKIGLRNMFDPSPTGYGAATPQLTSVTKGISLTVGEFTSVIMVVQTNSTASQISCTYYVNDASTSETITSTAMHNGGAGYADITPTEFTVGNRSQGGGFNCISFLQHLHVYDRPLTDSTDVQNLMNYMNGSGGSVPSSPYWSIDTINTTPSYGSRVGSVESHWSGVSGQSIQAYSITSWGNFNYVNSYYWSQPTWVPSKSAIYFPSAPNFIRYDPPPASASSAITAGTLSSFMSSSTATSVALATEVRAAIKNLSGAAQATAKSTYIAAMRAKEPSLKVAVPQTDFSSYIATFSNVPTAISSAAKPIDVILPSASNIVDITTASVDETKYTAIEMPVNTTMTVQDNGSSVGTLTYDGSIYTDGNGATYSVGDSVIFGTKKVTILGQGSALVSITNTYKSIEVNLNVEISANGTLNVLGYQPATPSNIVIASTLLPVDALYDSSNNIALVEFWEPDDRDDIMAQLASTQTLGGVEGYRITAKKLALGLQNCLIGSLDAKSAEPFNASMYGAAGAQNGNRVMTGFGRFALMAYAHYIMGHVQATAAITNDTDFMKGMLSLNSDTLTDYKYANIGNYDGAAAPWTTAGDASDANLAVRLVKTLIDNNPTTSLVSNGAATTVANIVKQVIGQDASRATDEDNNKYSPENHGLLRFYPDDVIYVSINLTTPTVTVGTGQQVSGPTMEDLYTNATGDKKYTIKLTLGPAA